MNGGTEVGRSTEPRGAVLRLSTAWVTGSSVVGGRSDGTEGAHLQSVFRILQ